MKTLELNETSATKDEFRSVDEFNKRFFPEPVDAETEECPDAEDIGEKLAKQSLDRLQSALSSK